MKGIKVKATEFGTVYSSPGPHSGVTIKLILKLYLSIFAAVEDEPAWVRFMLPISVPELSHISYPDREIVVVVVKTAPVFLDVEVYPCRLIDG